MKRATVKSSLKWAIRLSLAFGIVAFVANGFGITLPLFFEIHARGAKPVDHFVARGPNYLAQICPNEVTFSFADAPRTDEGRTSLFKLRWVDTNPEAELRPAQLLAGTVNRIRGPDPAAWQSGIPTCGRAGVHDIYSGIDLVYYGTERQLECDIVVSPGSDPGAIAFEWSGADHVRIEENGGISFSNLGGQLYLCRPELYQWRDGKRVPVAGAYLFSPDHNRIRFQVGFYDPREPLVIDPIVVYDQLKGGSASEYASAIATDADGNVYVTGYTFSADLPTRNPIQGSKLVPAGDPDVFVMKVDPRGSSLIYATYLGGTVGQVASGIAVDANRNAWVTGWTGSTDFPLQNPLQAQHHGGTTDVFIAKLDASGSKLLFSTLLGGNAQDFAAGLALDAAGNAYITGSTASTDLETINAYQPKNQGVTDGFVAKLDASGSHWHFITYLGGSSVELGTSIAVTRSGNAVVTGTTGSLDFPLVQPWQPALHGTTDVYVAEFDPTGTALRFSTLLGGSLDEFSTGIAVGPSEDIWLTGATSSSDFPTLNAFQSVFKAGQCTFNNQKLACTDAFITRLRSDGKQLVFSSYLGGDGVENPTAPLAGVLAHSLAIAVDAQGFAYLTGTTGSTNFPVLNPIQPTLKGETDLFVTKVHPAGPLVFSTYCGGAAQDGGTGITADAAGNIYVAGWTQLSSVGGGGGKRSIGGSQNDVKLLRLFELPVTPELSLTSLGLFFGRFNAQGVFELTLSAPTNRNTVIEASTNLVDWTALPNQ